MVSTVGWLYLVGGTVLFFFWAYGIVSFVLDLKTYIIPGVKGILTERRADAEAAEREREQTEKKKQLY